MRIHLEEDEILRAILKFVYDNFPGVGHVTKEHVQIVAIDGDGESISYADIYASIVVGKEIDVMKEPIWYGVMDGRWQINRERAWCLVACATLAEAQESIKSWSDECIIVQFPNEIILPREEPDDK